MSYNLGNRSVLFRAHNTNRQTAVPVGSDYTVDNFFECIPSTAGAGVHISRRAYVYGDIRTAGYSSEQQNGDVSIRNATSMLSEGWQLRTNASGTTCADDAIYGVVESRAVLYNKNSYSSQTITSDAEETRLFGVKLP